MDPLSISVAIVSLIDFTEKVLTIANDIKNARKDLQKVVDGLKSLDYLIKRLDELRKEANEHDPWFQGLLELERTSGTLTSDWRYVPNPKHKPEGALAQLKITMAELHAKLEPHGLNKFHFVQRVRWHWEKDSYAGMLNDIARSRSEISDILDRDHFDLSKHHLKLTEAVKEEGRDTNLQVGELVNYKRRREDKERREEDNERRKEEKAEKEAIVRWLSPLENLARQKKLFANSFPTGQWLLDSLAFKHWITGRPWYLRCYGEAGSGKTTLSAIVVDHLQHEYKDQNIPVLCLYLEHKESKTQTRENLLGSLLKQLVQLKTSNAISSGLKEAYETAKDIKATPTLKELRELLQAELVNYSRVFLVVDALDECDPSSRRDELLADLRELQQQNLSTMVTSRRFDGEEPPRVVDCSVCGGEDVKIYYRCTICDEGEFDICQDCKEQNTPCRDVSHNQFEPYERVEVEIRTPDAELTRYVEWEIGKDINDYGVKQWDERIYTSRPDSTRFYRKLKKDPDLLERIPAVIVKKSQGKFLYAKLYIDSLKAKQTRYEIEKTLDSFPDELENIYEEAMDRVRSQADHKDRDLGLKALAFIVCAHRYLSLAELQHALAIRPGDTSFNKKMDYDKEDILLSTTGLITIDSDNAVRLVHLTLQVYLDAIRKDWYPEMEVEMANACLTCLNYDTFSKPCQYAEDFEAKKEESPFIAYTSQYWGDHVRDAGPNPDLRDKTVHLVGQPLRIDAYIQAAWFTNNGADNSWDVRRDIDGRHVCAWFGLTTIITELEQMEKDVDVQELTYGQTPLMYACRKGHVEVVRELLDLGASIDLVSSLGRTALLEAIAQNHEEIVGVLLDRNELDLNSINLKDHSRSALMIAANLGHFSIVARLLEHKEVTVNQQDSDGLTALSLACLKHSFLTVKLLLQRQGIDVNSADYTAERSALILAAEINDSAIVELLLQNGANPAKEDRGGGTAVLRAVDYGSLDVVEAMLRSDVGVDFHILDHDYRGLMHSASVNGQPSVIRLLKEIGLDPNIKDKNGLTPLHDASRSGKPEVTETLLDLGADASIEDNNGRTAFTVAWQYGQIKIMSLLKGENTLRRGQPIPNGDQLPVWSLAMLGLSDQLEEAIAKGRVDLSTKEPGSEYTALHWAVEAKQIIILRLLLDKGHMPPDEVNHESRTPLHLAAYWGNLEAAVELLSHGANPNSEDRWGTTALFIAQFGKHFTVAVALIEKGAAIDKEKVDVKELLFAAIRLDNVEAVASLLKNGADVLSRNSEGVPAIQLAKQSGNGELMKMLRSHPSFLYGVRKATEDKDQAAPSKIDDIREDESEDLGDKEDEGYSSQVSDNGDSTSFVMPNVPREVLPFRSRPAKEPVAA